MGVWVVVNACAASAAAFIACFGPLAFSLWVSVACALLGGALFAVASERVLRFRWGKRLLWLVHVLVVLVVVLSAVIPLYRSGGIGLPLGSWDSSGGYEVHGVRLLHAMEYVYPYALSKGIIDQLQSIDIVHDN